MGIVDELVSEVKDYFAESKPYDVKLIIVGHQNVWFIPEVVGEIEWETEYRGSPSKLTFTVLKHDYVKSEMEELGEQLVGYITEKLGVEPKKKDPEFSFPEGAPVHLLINDKFVFSGFVFEKTRDKDQRIRCVCYDQLRYLKNKHTMLFEEGLTATQAIRRIADDFELNVGELVDTKHKLPARIEKSKTLLDMIYRALDITTGQTGVPYIFYDNCGMLTLRVADEWTVPLVINQESASNFDYTSSIDRDTYTQYFIYHNEKNGKGNCGGCTAENKPLGDFHPHYVKTYGVLQYHEQVEDDINLKAYGDWLLETKCFPTRHLSVSGVMGDLDVRAGCIVPVQLNLGDMDLNYTMMRCDTVTHRFTGRYHLMDVTLSTRNGQFGDR